MRFRQAYANSAVCSATRTAPITGRYQYRLPVGLEEPISGGRDLGLDPSHPTLPSLLKSAGYATALVGKWHLGKLPRYGPLKSGYDHFYGFRGGAVDYVRHTGTDHRDDLWDGDVAVHEAGYLTTLLGDRAVAAIDRFAAENKPFLLSLHFSAPHWPWEAPGDEAEAERLRGANLRDFDGGTQATYRRMVEAMDAEIGRALAALARHGLTQDTIVVFTSDNGGERFSDTWPFTGRKTELLEGGLRIPAVVSWPARIPAGRTSDQVMISMDWLPTLLAAAGAVPDPAYQGQRPARRARGRRQVPQDPRRGLPLRRRRRSARARQPQGAPPRGVQGDRGAMARLERDHAARDRRELHRGLHGPPTPGPLRHRRGADQSRQSVG